MWNSSRSARQKKKERSWQNRDGCPIQKENRNQNRRTKHRREKEKINHPCHERSPPKSIKRY